MSFENREAWVARMFEQYGFKPDPGVIAALTSQVPTDDQRGVASATVGQYINAFNQLQKAAANDPLIKMLIDEQSATTAAGSAAEGYATQVQDVYKQAPKLFGAMTPEQIDQYLSPLKNQFDYSEGKVQTDAAARGNTGSSLEATALAGTNQQFKQNVLSQGLQEQQNLANVIQNLYNQRLAQQNLLYGLQQNTAGQLSQNKLQEAEFMAQLPILLGGQATQAGAMNQNRDSTPWGAIGTLAGMAGGAALAPFTGGLSIPMGMMLGGSLGGAAGSIGQGFAGGNSTMANGGAGMMMNLPLLYGMMGGNRTSSSGVPAGLNWASQPGSNSTNLMQSNPNLLPLQGQV